MGRRRAAIKEGKGLLNLVLGANRWELDKDEVDSA